MNFGDTATRGWNTPPQRSLKINSDVVVRGTVSFLDIMARDEAMDLVEAHSFKVSTLDRLIAKLLAVRKSSYCKFAKWVEKYLL